MNKMEFWFDFASTYSYLTAMRIAALGAAADVAIVYRPFLLGPIFNSHGMTTSPFVLNPIKGRYMERDIGRIARSRGLEFRMPDRFPAHSLSAARIGMVAEAEGWISAFTPAVFAAEFARGEDIASPDVLRRIVTDLGHDPTRVFEAASSAEIKSALRTRTETAAAKEIFGAPTFITKDGELFWGDDRLEQAMEWAALRQ